MSAGGKSVRTSFLLGDPTYGSSVRSPDQLFTRFGLRRQIAECTWPPLAESIANCDAKFESSVAGPSLPLVFLAFFRGTELEIRRGQYPGTFADRVSGASSRRSVTVARIFEIDASRTSSAGNWLVQFPVPRPLRISTSSRISRWRPIPFVPRSRLHVGAASKIPTIGRRDDIRRYRVVRSGVPRAPCHEP